MSRTRSPRPAVAELYTVGHSNHAIEHFLALLRRHGVETVADVRSRPYSRFVPHFGKERLARLLEDAGLGYLFLGRELGGKPPKGERHAPAMTYQVRVAQPEFREGLDRLLRAAGTNRVALLCRERDPLECHRFHLDLPLCPAAGPRYPAYSTERRSGDAAGHRTPAPPTRPHVRATPVSGPDGARERAGPDAAYDEWWYNY